MIGPGDDRTRTRAHPFRDAGLALSTLSAVPVRVEWPGAERTDAPGYYPLVGLGIGGLGLAVAWLVRVLGLHEGASLVAGGVIVAVWCAATRMIHWDGLGDVADGFWAHDPARRLEIMSDSALGAFGATAIALGIVIQVSSIGSLLADGRTSALLVVPVFARAAATFGAWFGRAAKPGGLGASVTGRPRPGAVVPAALAIVAVCALCISVWGFTSGLGLSASAVALSLGVPHVLALRFGGVTGDVLGASVVIVESLLFAGVAMWM